MPSLQDGSFSCGVPGSKLPGYYHLVPTGPKLPDLCPIFDSTSDPPIEDEDDDEYEDETEVAQPPTLKDLKRRFVSRRRK